MYPLDKDSSIEKSSFFSENLENDKLLSLKNNKVLQDAKNLLNNDYVRLSSQWYTIKVENYFGESFLFRQKTYRKELTKFINKKEKDYYDRHKITSIFFMLLTNYVLNNGYLEHYEKTRFESVVKLLTK